MVDDASVSITFTNSIRKHKTFDSCIKMLTKLPGDSQTLQRQIWHVGFCGAWMTVISIGLSQSCLQLLHQAWGSACPLDNTGRTAVGATVHEFPTALRLSEPGALAEASPSRDGLRQIQERNIPKKYLKHL